MATEKYNSVKKIVTVIITNIVLLEIISVILVFGVRFKKPNLSLDLVIENHIGKITADKIDRWSRSFHPQLGFVSQPNQKNVRTNRAGKEYVISSGPDAARSDGRLELTSFMNVYGDSFVAGDEVNEYPSGEGRLS